MKMDGENRVKMNKVSGVAGKRQQGLLFLLALLVGLFLAACGSGTDLEEPPDIRYGEDVCQRCAMIINEARYAATYVTPDGQTKN